MADTTERLPFPLSSRSASLAASIISRNGRALHHAIAGIPFQEVTSGSTPFVMQTVQMQKNQTDVEPDPGEQSLTGWWLRSQASFHEGAGVRWQESRTAQDSFSFWRSENIDPWHPGELRLERQLVALPAAVAGATCVRPVTNMTGTGPKVVVGRDGGAFSVNANGGPSAPVTNVVSGVGAVQDIIMDDASNRFYSISLPSSGQNILAVGTPNTDKKTVNLNVRSLWGGLLWAKHRLWAYGAFSLYQPDVEAIASGAATGPLTPFYTVPDKGFRWTALCDGPSFIYAAGNGTQGAIIQGIEVDTSDGGATTTVGPILATLPRGEVVHKLAQLAGSYLAIGTNRGLRVAQIQSDGGLVVGPLTIDLNALYPQDADHQVYGECVGLDTYGTFFCTAFTLKREGSGTIVDGALCGYKVDTSTIFDDGTCPWAAWAQVPSEQAATGTYVSALAVTNSGDCVLGLSKGSTGVALYGQSRTKYAKSGWWESSLIRFRTQEPKTFRGLSVGGQLDGGTVKADLVVNDSIFPVGSFTRAGTEIRSTLDIGTNLGPQREVGVRFTLNASSDALASPVLSDYQVKAYPSVAPQHRWQIPLLCADQESWGTGQQDGHDGWGAERLAALMALEKNGSVVTWQNFTELGGAGGTLVKIDSVEFVRTAVPDLTRPNSTSGIVQVTLVSMNA